MTGHYTVLYTAAARRHMNRLPLPTAAAAIHEHLMGPVAENPRRLGNSWMHRMRACGARGVGSTAPSTRSTRRRQRSRS